MANAPHALRVELKNLLANQLSAEELDNLIYALDINDLPARPTQSLKAQEVVGYLDRRLRLAELVDVGPTVRDDLPWVELLTRYGYGPAAPAAPPIEVSYLDLQKLVPILAEAPGFLSAGNRKSFLATAGVDRLVNVNLEGSPMTVAGTVLTELNRYGRTTDRDVALNRLLTYLTQDETLPPSRKQVITDIVGRYGLDKIG